MTLVNNAAIETFGAFDRGGGFSTALANFVTDGAGGFSNLSQAAEQFGVDTRAVFDGFANLFDPIERSGNAVFDALGIKVLGFQEQIQSLLDSFDRVANFDANIENAVKRVANRAIDRAGGGQHFEYTELSNAGGRFRSGARLSRARSRAEQAARRLEGQGFIVPRNADGSINEAGVRRRAPSAATRGGGGAGSGDDKEAKAAAKKTAADAKRAAREQERLADKARRDEQAFQQDLARAQDDQLRAQLDLTVDQTERVKIQQALLDHDRDARLKAIQNDEDLTAEQKKQLSVLVTETSFLESRLLHRQDHDALAKLALEKAQAQSDNEIDILDAQSNLARTTKERAAIERQILDKQFDMLRLVQQNALDEATRKGDAQGAAIAQARLGTLNTLQAYGRQQIDRRNQGPLAAYLDSIPKTAEEVNEALEGIQANGLSDLIDGLAKTKGSFKDLAAVVSSVADDIISSLIRIGLQKGIAALFGSILGSGSATTYGNPFADSGNLTLPGVDLGFLAGARAKGGSVVGGRNYLVGERGVEIFTAPHSGNIIANDDIATGGGMKFEQHLHVAGAVDLATRTEVYRLAGATKDAAVAAIHDANRRRP